MAVPTLSGPLFSNPLDHAAAAMNGDSRPMSNGEKENGGARKIHIASRRMEGGIEFETADTVPGVPGEGFNRIFDPFYSREEKTGMGVGLANCMRIIANHAGTIQAANSQEGFVLSSVRLPTE